MKKITCLVLLMTMSVSIAVAQDVGSLLRFPALSADGSQLAFSYQGDIWMVASDGGVARRLTIHESYESHPQWDNTGDMLVFQGNRWGNDDIYLINAQGGRPQRLTYRSTGDVSAQWGKDGIIYFNTNRNFREVEREPEVYQVAVTGGAPTRALDALGYNPIPSPNGRFIALQRGHCRITREAYRGPANRDIWLYDTQQDRYIQLTDFDGQDIYPQWGDDHTLYMLSARNSRYNIYRLTLNSDGEPESETEAITDYENEGIRYYDVSADGELIVFEKGTDIWTMSTTPPAKPVKLEIDITQDYRFDPIEHKTYTDQATAFSLSPNEKYLAFVVRGEIFITQNDKDKSRAIQITDHVAHDRQVAWLSDTVLVFISDRDGDFGIYKVQSTDEKESDLFKTFKRETQKILDTDEEEMMIELSPDREKIAIQQGRGKLVVANIDSMGTITDQRTLLDGWDSPGGLSWSPDSRWLAYSLSDLDFNSEIFIHAVDDSQPPVNISYHPRSDQSPIWSRDGSKLGFLSIRNNGDTDVWFVWLRKEDWEKTKSDWEEEPEDNGEKKDTVDKEEGIKKIEIDFKDIHERLVQVTSLPGNEGNLAISADGETFFFTTNQRGRTSGGGDPELKRVKWDGSEMKTLIPKARVSGLTLDTRGNYFYMLQNRGSLGKLAVEGGGAKGLPFKAKMDIHHEAERRQIFDEAWRTLRDGFYDPNFHGRDWKALREKYEPLALSASTTQDFRDMFNEMLGQVNASHMGMYGQDPEETQEERSGLIGVEVKPHEQGLEITSIVPGSPVDKTESKLSIGEVILTVNGESTQGKNLYQLLEGMVDERTLLEVEDTKGNTREVIIRPTGSLVSEQYDAWVDKRKELTDKYSGGRLGYIHIQGMNWPSFERFERELMASGYGKEGIVIDVRFNGGGWTTDMLMAVLNVDQHAYTVPRGAAQDLEKEHPKFRDHYPFGERLPLSSWHGPSIALCNEASYSNAEIFSHAYKTLGIGKLVGKPTFGAVISTGGRGLIDGSYVRLPFRGWYVKATGENMEHGPAVPDYIVSDQPDSKAEGEDPQLEKAVDILLEQIDGTSEIQQGGRK